MAIDRFQIEDLVAQDASGVVFRAIDRETGGEVAVRRFFPHGFDMPGLLAEERTAFLATLDRLTKVRHPALRTIIAGGCDPVDDMPFLATEWIEGDRLDTLMDQGHLTVEAARFVAAQALEASAAVSRSLGYETLWIEPLPDTIVVRPTAESWSVHFGVRPLPWLVPDLATGFQELVALLVRALGWSNLLLQDNTGGGFGAWLRMVRDAPEDLTLVRARELIDLPLGASGAPPMEALPVQPGVPTAFVRPRPRRWPWIVAGGAAAMLALSAIVWDMRGLPGAENLPGTAAPERPLSPAEMANLRARELMAARGGIPASDLASKVFGPDDGDALLRHAGVTVTVGGTVREVDLSDDGKSLHLVLQGSNARALRGRIDATNPPQGLSMEELEKLKGRNVELHGEIDAQPYRGGYRARILIDDAADLRVKP